MAAFVQIAEAFGTGSGVTTKATPSLTVTASNLLVFCLGGSSTTVTISSVTDTLGSLSWQQCSGAYNPTTGGANDFTDIWWAIATGGATGAVTAHYSGSLTFGDVQLLEYSLAGYTAAFETAAVANSVFATSVTTGAFSPANAGNLSVAVCRNPGGGVASFTAGANYTIRNASDAVEDRLACPAGSQTASFSWSGSNWGKMSVASFSLAAPYVPPVIPQLRMATNLRMG